MPLSGSEVTQRLLQQNFLPRVASSADELPPCFTSVSWMPKTARKLSTRPGRKSGYDAISIDVTRYNLVPRRLELPHPSAFARTSVFIGDEWSHFEHVQKSRKSRIKPSKFADGRVVSMLGARGRRISRFGSRFLATADINSFYPSLYTHAIPWALVGQSVAKKNRSNTDWFNKIDALTRASRRQETVGVAVGPGTSAIVAEIVLLAIDNEPKLKGFKYERFIDDYTMHASSREEAEQFLSALGNSLRKFNLSLNPRKTRIDELPIARTPTWVRSLKADARQLDASRAQEVLDFLDLAVELTTANPDASALKYALSMLERKLTRVKSTKDLQTVARALLSLSFHRPIVLPFVVRLILKKKLPISSTFVAHIGELLLHHSAAHRTDAVCWLLYLVQRRTIPLPKKVEDKIVEGEDCLPLVMLLHLGSASAVNSVHAFANGLVASPDDYERDRYWLLLYELQASGKISAPYGQHDTDFKVLIDDNVSFLDFGVKVKIPARVGSAAPYLVTE